MINKETNKEAIETLRANYPDACYDQLRKAVDAAIEALKAQDAAGDTISRQDAVNEAKELYDMGDCYCDRASMIGMLNSLPPAQPDIKQAAKLLSDFIEKLSGRRVVFDNTRR